MSPLSLLLSIVALSILAYGVLKALSDIKMRNKMKKREAELERRGVGPFGSTLAHGMVYNKTTGKIRPDQTKSITWYRRLID